MGHVVTDICLFARPRRFRTTVRFLSREGEAVHLDLRSDQIYALADVLNDHIEGHEERAVEARTRRAQGSAE